MEGGNTFTARIERLAAGGAGVLRLDGMVLFMDYSAPGDLVRGSIVSSKGSWGRAALVEVIEASDSRVSPVCGLYGRCGGCTLQHISYPTQLSEKQTMVRDAFARIGQLVYEDDIPLVPSAPFEYRNRMRFHPVAPPGPASSPALSGPAAPGLKERRGSAALPLEDCPAADPGIRKALKNKTLTVPPGQRRLAVYSRNKTFLVQGGKSRGTVVVAGRELALDAACFFQSNGTLLETLITDLLDAAGKADSRLPAADVFSGVGVFSAFLSEYFTRVDLVDENGPALELARQNIGSPGARFFPQKDYEWAARCRERYGFMVLDPPRSGISRTLGTFLVERGAPLLAYVSCNPATLARDAKLLAGAYRLSSLKAYDFYPQTPHIECLALFTREGTG
jgi:23S rRNA (uracil1939-C5)-methyltransferase